MKEIINQALNSLNKAFMFQDIWINLEDFIKDIELVEGSIKEPSIQKEQLKNFTNSMKGFNEDIKSNGYMIDKCAGGPPNTFVGNAKPKDCYRYLDCQNQVLIFRGDVYNLKNIVIILEDLK